MSHRSSVALWQPGSSKCQRNRCLRCIQPAGELEREACTASPIKRALDRKPLPANFFVNSRCFINYIHKLTDLSLKETFDSWFLCIILSFTIFLLLYHKKIIDFFILEKIIEYCVLIENIIYFSVSFLTNYFEERKLL